MVTIVSKIKSGVLKKLDSWNGLILASLRISLPLFVETEMPPFYQRRKRFTKTFAVISHSFSLTKKTLRWESIWLKRIQSLNCYTICLLMSKIDVIFTKIRRDLFPRNYHRKYKNQMTTSLRSLRKSIQLLIALQLTTNCLKSFLSWRNKH